MNHVDEIQMKVFNSNAESIQTIGRDTKVVVIPKEKTFDLIDGLESYQEQFLFINSCLVHDAANGTVAFAMPSDEVHDIMMILIFGTDTKKVVNHTFGLALESWVNL